MGMAKANKKEKQKEQKCKKKDKCRKADSKTNFSVWPF